MNENIYYSLIFSIPVILLSAVQLFNLKYRKRLLSVLTLVGFVILIVTIIFIYLILYFIGFIFSFSADLTKETVEKLFFNDNNAQFELTSRFPKIINIFYIILIIYFSLLIIINIINIIRIKNYLIVTSLILTLIPYFFILYLIIF